jgi:DNA-directed RNA polymerase specialized sigma24 family protein
MRMTEDQQAFIEFLRRLDPDSPSTEMTYKKIRLKLVKYFNWKRCYDPEEHADETIRRVTDNLLRVAVDSIERPASYLYAVAKNVYREHIRSNVKQEELVKALQELWPTVFEEQEDCRIWCLQNLAPEKAELIIPYYSSKKEREELIQSKGRNLNQLRLQIHRIKKELKACKTECLKQKQGAK